MKSYQTILSDVVNYGRRKENRTGVDTFALPNQHFSHNMAEGFPAVTTKKLAFKTMATELEGFIKGITSKRWYQERGCKIWDEWANPERVRVRFDETKDDNDYSIKHLQAMEDDLGPIYGYQWRKWNENYENPYENNGCDEDGEFLHDDVTPVNGSLYGGIDQLKQVVDKLKTNPNDRRMVVSAWNPGQIHMMALPPCHMMFVLTHIDGELSLHWTQRSCDLFLGVPFNIASYGLLLELLCKEVSMKPGNLSGMLCDCHLYENQIKQAKLQLERTPRELPELQFKKWRGFFKWQATDVELSNYNPYPPIKAEVAV